MYTPWGHTQTQAIDTDSHTYTHNAHVLEHTHALVPERWSCASHTHMCCWPVGLCFNQNNRSLKVSPCLLGIDQFLTTRPALGGEIDHIWNEE